MIKKWLKRIAIVAVAIFVAIQFVPTTALRPLMDKNLEPIPTTNPPVQAAQALNPPPAVAAVMRVACYDCHSNETRWPWYAHIAPMSWMLIKHVTEGRHAMNFSTWSDYKPDKQADYLRGVDDAVTNGWMPLSSYLLIHRDAVLTPEAAKLVGDWAHATAKQLDPSGSEDNDTPAKPATPGGA